MTSWLPDLAAQRGPRYRAIAEALAEDVQRGALPPGARLPTHRELAWRLKVTVGTVSRAYAEAERRGLIAGEVGRGTFVRAAATPAPLLRLHDEAQPADLVDFAVHRPRAASEGPLLADALAALAGDPELAELMEYQPHAGRDRERAAGAAWIARSGGLAATPGRVVVTASGQHAMAAVLAAITEPGDGLAVEALTYPGIRAAASLLHLKLVPLAIDDEGVLPDALASACRGGRVRALYTLPTLHNPTTAMMPLERRRALAEVARRHQVMLIEDDVYGFLAERPLPALTSLAPEHGFYITATSKSFVPGLRVGYVHCPAALVDDVAAAVRAMTYTAPPLTARIASRWIEDGIADRLVAEKRAEAARRQHAAQRLLPQQSYRTSPGAAHLWLTLPEPWQGEAFAAAARQRGIAVTPAAAFATGRQVPRAVRLCIGTPPSLAAVAHGLARLAELLAAAPEGYLSVV
ncbi:MAG TPA: PLP-dependent aminotransferase family protein [Stellaceae bacterium]|jgi:DNA-binding transcriptional MocR family regulator|nr:PLP-dependent aminotransferase family protein [Stellaceae bacterium]